MESVLLCSNCFQDQGLRLFAHKIGIENPNFCKRCKTCSGHKLTKSLTAILAYEFFTRGSVQRCRYGFFPEIMLKNSPLSSIEISSWLSDDVRLISDILSVGFCYHTPEFWMRGENVTLKYLRTKSKRDKVISEVLRRYPSRNLEPGEIFYRLRKNPVNPSKLDEYDSPPPLLRRKGRLNSDKLSIMYGSQDLEICVHECRATVEDELYFATLTLCKKMRLLDLTEIIHEEAGVTELESIDMALHLLFLAGKHSYHVSREIASSVFKAGYGGLIYPSYFSLSKTGATPLETIYDISIRRVPSLKRHAKSHIIPNLALFGRPIEEGLVKVRCLNRLVIRKVEYDLQFGPLPRSKESSERSEAVSRLLKQPHPARNRSFF